MRLNLQMYLLIFIGASVIFYQYHLSKGWVMTYNNSQEIREIYAYKKSDGTNLIPTIVSRCSF